MDSPLVSVILATYNGSRYLSEAIESVLAQDYKNLELIIIDDASTDPQVAEIIHHAMTHDIRVRAYRNEKNMERSYSKNSGISEAKGGYIAFIDDDDIWEKLKIGKQMDSLLSDVSIGIVGTYARFIDEDQVMLGSADHLKTRSDAIHDTMLLSNQFIHSSVLIRKDIFLEAGGFPDFNLCEDYDLWLRVLRITKGMNIPERLIGYRVRNTSTTSKNLYKMKWMTIKIVWKYKKSFPNAFSALFFKCISFPFHISFLMKIQVMIFRK